MEKQGKLEKILRNKLTLCTLYETRVKSNKADSIIRRFFEGWSVLNNYQEATNVRIWFYGMLDFITWIY